MVEGGQHACLYLHYSVYIQIVCTIWSQPWLLSDRCSSCMDMTKLNGSIQFCLHVNNLHLGILQQAQSPPV